MNNLISDKGTSIVLHILYAIAGAILLNLYTATQLLLFINGHFSDFTDIVMYHITRLPEIAYIIFILALGLFTQRRYFLAIIISLVVCAMVIVLTKYLFFTNAARPSVWLTESGLQFHTVADIRLHSNGSFPSGHTMAAFCTMALAAFVSKKWWTQLLFFTLALLSGYSRVYVAQHYFLDIYVGGLLGFTIAWLCFSVFESKFKTPYWLLPIIKI